MRHNDAKNMTPSPRPLLFASYPDFWLSKNDYDYLWLKMSIFWIKKANWFFFVSLQQKIEPNWGNHLFELKNQVEHNATNIQTAPDCSSATAIMLQIFWSERDSAFFLIAWIHSTTNLKSYEQAENFINPAGTQSSSEEPLKEKRHTFIGMCPLLTWLSMSILIDDIADSQSSQLSKTERFAKIVNG